MLTGHPLSDAERETLRRQRAEVFFKLQGMAEILKELEARHAVVCRMHQQFGVLNEDQ